MPVIPASSVSATMSTTPFRFGPETSTEPSGCAGQSFDPLVALNDLTSTTSQRLINRRRFFFFPISRLLDEGCGFISLKSASSLAVASARFFCVLPPVWVLVPFHMQRAQSGRQQSRLGVRAQELAASRQTRSHVFQGPRPALRWSSSTDCMSLRQVSISFAVAGRPRILKNSSSISLVIVALSGNQLY